MRILVTGSAGTLGTPLVKELRLRGHEVTGSDLRHWPGEIRTDVAEIEQLRDAFLIAKPQVVYHLAGEFGRKNGEMYSEQLWRSNCLGTHNVIECCEGYGARLIFASSSEAYGDLADCDEPLKERELDCEVPDFHNEYALTKWTNEQQIRIAIRNHGLNATILRFFNVYGPGEYYSDYRSVVCLFIYRALKQLPVTVYHNSVRSFLYIDDWVQAVANVADISTKELAFNVASTQQVNMGELFKLVEQAVGDYSGRLTVIEKEVGNVQSKSADVSKAVAAFGLKETVDLAEGIRRTVEWMRRIYE